MAFFSKKIDFWLQNSKSRKKLSTVENPTAEKSIS